MSSHTWHDTMLEAKGSAACGMTWHTQLVMLLGPTVTTLLTAVVAVTAVVLAAAVTARALNWAQHT